MRCRTCRIATCSARGFAQPSLGEVDDVGGLEVGAESYEKSGNGHRRPRVELARQSHCYRARWRVALPYPTTPTSARPHRPGKAKRHAQRVLSGLVQNALT